MQDSELSAKLRKGDPEALELVMERYTRLLWSVAGAILKNTGASEDIEECVSDVFTALWRNPAKWNPKRGELRTYLALLARSKALNMAKRLGRRQTVPLEETLSSGDVVTLEVLEREAETAAESAIAALPEPDREIFIRRHLLGQSPNAIARAMEIPVRQVSNRLYRGRGKLKTMLQGQEV
jgi:RNA polymerase sigma-70 factor (ECF subfamily)